MKLWLIPKSIHVRHMWGRPIFYGGCVFMFLDSFLICHYIKEIRMTLSEVDLLDNWFSMRWFVASLNILAPPPKKIALFCHFWKLIQRKHSATGFGIRKKHLFEGEWETVTQGFVTSLGCNVFNQPTEAVVKFFAIKKMLQWVSLEVHDCGPMQECVGVCVP